MSVDPAGLVLRIDKSFGGNTYPGDEDIVRDSSGSDPESIRIRETLKGKHWRDIPFDTLERLRFALPFLSAEGYRFYLPAFMVASIIDFQRAGVIPDEVVLSLTPPLPSDVDRIRNLAKAHPEVHPFDEEEWDELIGATDRAYARGGPVESTFLERVPGFTAPQLMLIREFLEFMRDAHGDEFPDHEPERALQRYWSSLPRSTEA